MTRRAESDDPQTTRPVARRRVLGGAVAAGAGLSAVVLSATKAEADHVGAADHVTFDNTGTGLTATNVQDAIGEVNDDLVTLPELTGAVDALATTPDQLPPGDIPDGTEVIPALQNGGGVRLTSAQLAGSPADAMLGMTRDRYRVFEHFTGFAATVTTTGTLLDGGTQVRSVLNGSGAQISQSEGTQFFPGVAQLSTGSDSTPTNARCAIQARSLPIGMLFDPTNDFRFGARVNIPVLSGGGQEFEVRIGLLDSWSTAPVNGFMIMAEHGQTNFRAKNLDDDGSMGGSSETGDTGVLVATGFHDFFIEWDAANSRCRYFVYDATGLLGTDDIAGSVPDLNTSLLPGVGIFKSVGSVARSAHADWLGWDIYMPNGPARL